MKDKALNVKWKKAVIQIAREMKKANQIIEVIGSGLLKNRLDAIRINKGKVNKSIESERLSYVR